MPVKHSLKNWQSQSYCWNLTIETLNHCSMTTSTCFQMNSRTHCKHASALSTCPVILWTTELFQSEWSYTGYTKVSRSSETEWKVHKSSPLIWWEKMNTVTTNITYKTELQVDSRGHMINILLCEKSEQNQHDTETLVWAWLCIDVTEPQCSDATNTHNKSHYCRHCCQQRVKLSSRSFISANIPAGATAILLWPSLTLLDTSTSCRRPEQGKQHCVHCECNIQ